MSDNIKQRKKIAVFTFGRFNPPTKGHLLLINTTKQLSYKKNADFFIFVSPSVDKIKKSNNMYKYKNPLSWKYRIDLLKKLTNTTIVSQQIKSPHDVILFLSIRKYNNVTFVVGGDRVQEFKNRWIPYAKQYFDHCNIHNAGNRNKITEVSKYSATLARHAVINNDIKTFKKYTGWANNIAVNLFEDIKQVIYNGNC